MDTINSITVKIFDLEIGKLNYDIDKKKSFFQYNPTFLESNQYSNLFPFIFKRVKQVQVFTEFEGETFRGLPPMIADSLPDVFGNIIFKEWLESKEKSFRKILPIEQLTYVANRGMGAIEYHPTKEIAKTETIEINEIVSVLKKVLYLKTETKSENLSDLSLLNVFKIGTSAGGARPKIIISEHKKTGEIISGDLVFSDDYNHYLVKLCLDEKAVYSKEKVEYAYYLLAKKLKIDMMPSKLISDKHFATLRFDRQKGKKVHLLTASGLTGWDFMKPENSTYENLFNLALNLKVPHKDLQELFKRMVFNLVFANIDDHLKNHSFIYLNSTNSWTLAPAYDLTYPLNALNNYLRISRALSINGKRENINIDDLLTIATAFSIKNPKKIILEIQNGTIYWNSIAENLKIKEVVINAISNEFLTFI